MPKKNLILHQESKKRLISPGVWVSGDVLLKLRIVRGVAVVPDVAGERLEGGSGAHRGVGARPPDT